ncbi:mitochondrial inner-membrane-bound regulator-domain-containing protein [Xylogone sp. PMI_703]|nr:mitochondrial inner-membrane-bound regulator-domain-containing protein [Xylogone sp. PMI_703]
MISRPVSSTHICLRCQLRLAKRPLTSRIQFFCQSTEASPEQATNHTRKARLRHRSGFKRPDIHRGGRLYGFRGNQLQEDHESLKTEALGKPAEVIVLRESRFKIFNSVPQLDPEESPEKVDILAQLDSERGLPGWNEVEDNINELRPEDGESPRNWEEFDKLVRVLQEGFTVSQLVRYINIHGKSKQKDQNLEDSESPILRKSAWMPDISKPGEHFDESPIRGYYWKSHTSKQRLVLLLVRDCWNLEVPELANGIGEIEVHIRTEDLELLLAPLLGALRSPLSVISEEYITDEQEKIEAFKSRGVIRITTTRQKADNIIEQLEEKLHSIQRLEVPFGNLVPAANKDDTKQLEKWIRTNIEDVLPELSRLTRTDIARLPGNKLLISSLEDDPKSTTSSRADVARRLLLTANAVSNRNVHSVAHLVTSSPKKGAFVLYGPTENLPWRDRLRQWSRFTYPASKASATELESPKGDLSSVKHRFPLFDYFPGISNIQGQQSVDESEAIVSHNGTGNEAHWSNKYFTESSAIIGNVLHSHTAYDPAIWMPSQRYNPSSNPLKSFSTSVPNISRILNEVQLENKQPIEGVTMRFLPSPWNNQDINGSGIGLRALDAFPAMEMRFSVHPITKALHLEDVNAIVQVTTADLMLPDQAVDLRFQQKTQSSLQTQPQGLAQINSFLTQSQLSLTSGKQLVTPPELALPISRHLCRMANEIVSPSSDLQDVQYVFAGLEYRNTVVMNYEGWRLLYTSIEAGKADGRRGELKLRAIKAANSGGFEALSQEDARHFIDSACRLAGSFQFGDVTPKVFNSESRIKVVKESNTDADMTPEPVRPVSDAQPISFLEKPSFEELGHAEGAELVRGPADVQEATSSSTLQ